MSGTAVVLTAHGTVESLDDLPEFLTNIRRGHAPPPDLLAEVRRRYEAIGGRSPLNRINAELAEALSQLMQEVQPILDARNRDKFSTNLGNFRQGNALRERPHMC